MRKRCSKCKIHKDENEFNKNKSRSSGIANRCKECRKEDRKEKREEMREYSKRYYERNKRSIALQSKIYRQENKEKILIRIKQHYKKNKEVYTKYKKKYYQANKEKIIKMADDYRLSKAVYETYGKKLTVAESPRLSKDGISLEVKCKYCGKYFIPTNIAVRHRINALNSVKLGDVFIYCSDSCKTSCPIYNQKKYPKGFKKVTSREVNPLVRQMCFERDNWRCQICGASQENAPLHCHHIEGYAQNLRLGNDVTNTVTLCKTCHKKVHKLPGCGYYELRCNKA
jgi:5-methylcytosine-specific restriction endonuclease McrA